MAANTPIVRDRSPLRRRLSVNKVARNIVVGEHFHIKIAARTTGSVVYKRGASYRTVCRAGLALERPFIFGTGLGDVHLLSQVGVLTLGFLLRGIHGQVGIYTVLLFAK